VKFLVDNCELNFDNLYYIINHDFDMNLITESIILNLIKQNKNDLINCIFKFNHYENKCSKFLFINILLFDIYGNKKTLSNEQINKLIFCNNNVIFNINERNNCSCSLFLKVISDKNVELVNLFLNYAKARDITLNLDEKDDFGRKLFFIAIENDNINIIKLLIEYADANDFVFNVNEKNKFGNYPFLKSVENGNLELVKLLIQYSETHEIILNLNDSNNFGYYLILFASINN